MFSLIIPIYKNEANIPRLLGAVSSICFQIEGEFEAVFIVDGSPDNSFLVLRRDLASAGFHSQLISLSRNFGAFAAIRAGLAAARGERLAVMAADLQEPPGLVIEMNRSLAHDECDIAIGIRTTRDDSWSTRITSAIFWWLYRRLVFRDVPPGGVDIFGCQRFVRDQLLTLTERHSSLVGLLFWIGFRRKLFPYKRARREIGVGAWSFAKKWAYMQDSIFSFSHLPISLLLRFGFLGVAFSVLFGLVVLVSAVSGRITVPGYAATIMVIIFFGTLNLLSIGVLGLYLWRVFENTKGRPLHIVMSSDTFSGSSEAGEAR